MSEESRDEVIPLVEETVTLAKSTVETGRVAIRISTAEEQVILHDQLISQEIRIDVAKIGRFVDVAPQVRQDGDVTIYPVVEEVFVKRLLLREEVRVTRTRRAEPYDETVTLRRQAATIEQTPSAEAGKTPQSKGSIP